MTRLVFGALLAPFAVTIASAAELCDAITSDSGFRKFVAKKTVTPEYPSESIRNKVTGVAVVKVCVRRDGELASLDIVASPAPEIAEALRTALRAWRFGPAEVQMGSGKAQSFGAKLVFYFVHRANEWLVLNSTDDFYVGPQFALTDTGVRNGSVSHPNNPDVRPLESNPHGSRQSSRPAGIDNLNKVQM